MSTVIDGKDLYSEAYTDLAARRGAEPSWLAELREAAMASFRELGLPTRRDEEWRFTSLKPLTDMACQPVAAEARAVAIPQVYDEFDAYTMAFLNGIHVPAASNIAGLPKGVTFLPFAEALRSHGALIEEKLGKLADWRARTFAALNTALFTDGFLLHVAKGVKLEKPLHVIFASAPGSEPTMSFTRGLIIIEEGAEVTLVETHAGPAGARYFTCPVVENYIAANTNVDHYKVQLDSDLSVHLAEQGLEQFGDSTFRSHSLTFGALLSRNAVFGYLRGEEIDAILNGLYVLRGKQHADTFMQMEHVAAHCDSHELYKGILDGEASAVFRGRIYVHSEAQKTDAKQTNQNLLLSDKAQIMSQPQLEIYADDVKCTHGATTGQLDKEALFYLRSRGMTKAEARNVLVGAFAGDITERLLVDAVRRKTEAVLADRLPTH